HSNVMNQLLHLISSSTFIYCYVLAFSNLTRAMCFGLASLFVRQFGHAVLEPPCHDKEALLLGFNTRNKSLILGAYLMIPNVHLCGGRPGPVRCWGRSWRRWAGSGSSGPSPWWGGRVVYLMWAHNVWLA